MNNVSARAVSTPMSDYELIATTIWVSVTWHCTFDITYATLKAIEPGKEVIQDVSAKCLEIFDLIKEQNRLGKSALQHTDISGLRHFEVVSQLAKAGVEYCNFILMICNDNTNVKNKPAEREKAARILQDAKIQALALASPALSKL